MIKVLVVEDSPVIREFLVHILNSDPEIKVIGTASNGEEALKFIRNKRPDAVTMDIHMPGMDGLETVLALHAVVPDLPALLLSGSVLDEAQSALAAQHVSAVVAKPCRLEELQALLGRARGR